MIRILAGIGYALAAFAAIFVICTQALSIVLFDFDLVIYLFAIIGFIVVCRFLYQRLMFHYRTFPNHRKKRN